MDPATADLFQRYMTAFEADHHRAALDFYTDDVTLRVPGNHRYSGEFHGREPVTATLAAFRRAAGGTLEVREVRDAAFMPTTAMVHVEMAAGPHRWERVIVYRLAGQRIREIAFFEFDVRTVERLFD
jgi:hypothetical protein